MASSPRASVPAGASAESGRLLAIDYGQRRLGLALSDELRLTARPLATLVRTNRRNDLRRLREIVRRHEVRAIVVGWPLHLDGAVSEMAEEAARFARRLHKELGLPVRLVDERLTSWAAERARRERGAAKRRGHSVDALAAALILEDFLGENAAARRAEC